MFLHSLKKKKKSRRIVFTFSRSFFVDVDELRQKDDVKHCGVNILRQKLYYSINIYLLVVVVSGFLSSQCHVFPALDEKTIELVENRVLNIVHSTFTGKRSVSKTQCI